MRTLALLSALALLLFIMPAAGRAGPGTQAPQPPLDDALTAPPRPVTASSTASDQRGLSQYMAGRVAVRLVLPESTGAAEPESEHWTPEEIAAVRTQVQRALDWWDAALPLANLSFSLRVEVAPTAYEPIRHSLADEELWIGDALRSLGFDGYSYFDQAYAAGDAARTEDGADWATTIFVVDSSAHPTGYFADGRFAYAYINGPFLVVTTDAGGYGAGKLAVVVAHELGHIFGALDQYASARIPCDRRSGYLDTPTSNSQYHGCGGREPSIMLEPLSAFGGGRVDASARAQVGYQDSDGDGLIDPLDTAPTVELVDPRLAVNGRPVLTGTAYDLPFPAAFQQPVTLNRIAAVEYRVDGGPWLPVGADDGAYDGPIETFFTELPLYDGSYTVEARARNSAGAASSPTARRVTVAGIGPAPAYSLSGPAFVAEPLLNLSVAAPAATLAVQVSEQADFAGASWQSYAPALTYELSSVDGARSVYVRFKDPAGLASLPLALSVTLDRTAPVGTALRDPQMPNRLRLRASDPTSGVAAVEVQVGDGTPAWQPFAEVITLGQDASDTPVTLRFRDGAGNHSVALIVPAGFRVSLPLIVR